MSNWQIYGPGQVGSSFWKRGPHVLPYCAKEHSKPVSFASIASIPGAGGGERRSEQVRQLGSRRWLSALVDVLNKVRTAPPMISAQVCLPWKGNLGKEKWEASNTKLEGHCQSPLTPKAAQISVQCFEDFAQ